MSRHRRERRARREESRNVRAINPEIARIEGSERAGIEPAEAGPVRLDDTEDEQPEAVAYDPWARETGAMFEGSD